MALRNKDNFKSTKDTRYADNTVGAISAQNSRDTFGDAADSFLFSAPMATVDVTGGTLTLDCQNMEYAKFKGSANITANKAISISNVTNLVKIDPFFFECNANVELSWPETSYRDYNDGRWNPGTQVWVAPVAGKYKAIIDYDGTNFYVDILPYYVNT